MRVKNGDTVRPEPHQCGKTISRSQFEQASLVSVCCSAHGSIQFTSAANVKVWLIGPNKLLIAEELILSNIHKALSSPVGVSFCMLALAAVPEWMKWVQEQCYEHGQTRVTKSVWRHTDTLTAHYPCHRKRAPLSHNDNGGSTSEGNITAGSSAYFTLCVILGTAAARYWDVFSPNDFWLNVSLSFSHQSDSVWLWSSGFTRVDVYRQPNEDKKWYRKSNVWDFGNKNTYLDNESKIEYFLYEYKYWLN